MTTHIQVFVSSKMVELREERETLAKFLPTLSDKRFEFTAWLFENDAPAGEGHIRETYLLPLRASKLYIGLLWNEFGKWTIDEFEEAGKAGIYRMLFLKDVEPEKRDPHLSVFLDKYGEVTSGITIAYFKTIEELWRKIQFSVDSWINRKFDSKHGSLSAILANAPESVPEQAETFIGRDGQLDEIALHIENGGKVLLHGFSGIGKTTLAAQATANWLRKKIGTALWLRVGAEEVEPALGALMRPFDPLVAITSIDSWRPHIIDLFQKNNVKLVILDDVWNAETLYHISKSLPRWCSVIITSREKYPIGNPLEVSKLPLREAIKVLNHYSGQNFTGDPDAAVLCDLFDNHTYALEIAGAIIKVDNISPKRLLQEIRSAPQEMQMPGGYSEKGRESVSSLIRKSLVFIKNPLEREVFLAFGDLVVPYATADMLHLILEQKGISADVNKVTMSLRELRRRSLAWRVDEADLSNEFFYIHDLAYSFVRKEVDATDDSMIMWACLKYATMNRQNIKALNPEIDNLVWAVQRFAAIGDNEAVIQIAGSVYGLEYDRAYILPGVFRGVQILLYAVEAANALSNPLVKAAFLIRLAIYHRMNRDIDGTISYLEAAITTFEHVQAEEAIASFLNFLADAHIEKDNDIEAVKCYEWSLDIYRKLNIAKGEAAVLRNIGDLYEKRNLWETALSYYDQAYQLSRDFKDDEFPSIRQDISIRRTKLLKKLSQKD